MAAHQDSKRHQLMPDVVATKKHFCETWGVELDAVELSPDILLGEDLELDKLLLDSLQTLSISVNQGNKLITEAEENMMRVLNGEEVTTRCKRSKPSTDEPIARSPKRPKLKEHMPEDVVQNLKLWLFTNFAHPYPTKEEKEQLAAANSLTPQQVSQWFTNARRRIVVPAAKKMQAGTATFEEIRRQHLGDADRTPSPSAAP